MRSDALVVRVAVAVGVAGVERDDAVEALAGGVRDPGGDEGLDVGPPGADRGRQSLEFGDAGVGAPV